MIAELLSLKAALEIAGAWSAESAAEVVLRAEKAAAPEPADPADADVWRQYLDLTGRAGFLQYLPDRAGRYRWAETAFGAIRSSGYTLADLLAQRVRRHPDRLLFRWADAGAPEWTYGAVDRRLRMLAGLFLISAPDEPRVAILADNCVESACCDLACLVEGIFVTPLSVHFDGPTLSWIFDQLGINIVVTDTDERRDRLEGIRSVVRLPFRVFRTRPSGKSGSTTSLDGACMTLDLTAVAERLRGRPRPELHSAATAMFTSGSTGLPKGVVFSQYNIVTKRFARAAALPGVGTGEVLLCYLPLYHTFGRYLEMLGTIFWGGTYVFAGNPSVETLLAQMQRVRPTGLVSVPLRWSQIRDAALEAMRDREGSPQHESALREIVGDRLRWGLSAAGFLDAKIFRFFQRHGVDLCSGFGMTEATGGITMTPPGEYVDNSVGIPLPGARIRFSGAGELQVAAPYVARYLPEDAGTHLPAIDPAGEYWLQTGDLFKLHDKGHLEIVDRIKDIYKNSRGQTVAPRRVEQKFDDVPGIKRAFLVGDHRDYNVLLLVPNPGEPVLQAPVEQFQAYFRHLVRAANAGLAPYERVVGFAVLDRDFEVERGELTAKGSYRRRIIEEHFRPAIEALYESSFALLELGRFRVRIPRWFFRDLGVLESDIVADEGGLHNTHAGLSLRLVAAPGQNAVRLGDLEYELTGPTIDLGLFVRQPRLWAGNQALVAFFPCKDGWDVPLAGISAQVRLPWDRESLGPLEGTGHLAGLSDERLREIHHWCSQMFLGSGAGMFEAVHRLGEALRNAGARYAPLIRRRLEALARHPQEELRCLAYRILLADEPGGEYSESFPAFVESGLTFLTEDSIRQIAESNLGESHLDALRQRLFRYRQDLVWPAEPVTREQFQRIFALLAAFARRHPHYFAPVRAELAAWTLHEPDPELAPAGRAALDAACRWYRDSLPKAAGAGAGQRAAAGQVLFEDGLALAKTAPLEQILADASFLTESVRLAFGEDGFDTGQIVAHGLWVSQLSSQHRLDLFRVSLNLRDGKHFDLLIATGDELKDRRAYETVLWMMALSSLPYAAPAVPQFGTYRADLGALSVAYVGDLTAWDRIREFSAVQGSRASSAAGHDWQRLLIRSMAAFFRLWRLSGKRLLPGLIGPANVVVPNADFRETALVLSLAGALPYSGPLAIVRPMLRNFYRQTAAHYPKSWNHLRVGWLFDAAIEGLGQVDGEAFLEDLHRELAHDPHTPEERELAAALQAFLQQHRDRPYLPLALMCAIDRFADWERINPNATRAAREEQADQVYRLYRLDRYSNLVRYHLYRHTYFARAGEQVAAAFNRLLEPSGETERTDGELERLSDLQAALSHPADRCVFSRMVLPQARPGHEVQITALGEGSGKQVVLRTRIADSHGLQYEVREPLGASEVGYMFRLLFEEGAPGQISEQEKFLVVLDDQERIVAALRYRNEDPPLVSLEGIAVSNALKGRRIGSMLLDDFCVRAAAAGDQVVRTGFILRRFFAANGFRADARWGGLVRFLS